MGVSPEETVQADTARARARTRDVAWLSHVHTEDKHVEWVGFNAYLDRYEASKSTKKPTTLVYLVHVSMRRLATLTRSWLHSSTWKRPWIPLECNTHTFSRPTALSDIVSCAMERPLPLEIYGAASPNVSYADVVSWVHRDADEGIRCGCAAQCTFGGVAGIITGKSLHCVPTVSSRQCSSRISSSVVPRRTRSWASTWRQSERTRLVLLVYWTWRKTIRKNIQIEKWDGERCSCHSAVLSCTEYCYCEGEIRAAVPSISTRIRINWLHVCRKMRESQTMMNDLWIDELLVSANFCYCWT